MYWMILACKVVKLKSTATVFQMNGLLNLKMAIYTFVDELNVTLDCSFARQ